MSRPIEYRAIIVFQGYPEGEADLEDRVRRAIETHPTLSFRTSAVRMSKIGSEPACAVCGGSGCAPDGETCVCTGWKPLGKADP